MLFNKSLQLKLTLLLSLGIGNQFHLYSQKQIIPQNGHSGSFIVSLSKNDSQLLTAGIDGKITLWDLQITKAIKHIKICNAPLLCADWSNDSKIFLSGGTDSILRQHNTLTGEKIREFKTQFGITKAIYHPSLNAIAIGGNTGTILVVDAESGGIYHEIKVGSYTTGLKFSSNGAILFVSDWSTGVSAYEMKEGKKMLGIPAKKGINTSGMQISNNDELVLLHFNNGVTELVNVFKSDPLGSLKDFPYYESASEQLYCEPILTSENQFVINTNKENNIVIGNRKDNSQTIYSNVQSGGKINSITPANKGGFFILTDVNGSMSIVYFTPEIYTAELALTWRKMQYVPERIFDVAFINNGDVLALRGNGYYNFNMRTGDMSRRDDDSAKINASEYFVRYVAVDGVKDIYYYTDLVKHVGYTVNGKTTTPLKAFAYSDDTSILAIQNSINEILVYNIRNKKIIYHNKSQETSQLFNGVLANSFVFQKGKNLFKINPANGEITSITLTTESPVMYACHDKKTDALYILDNFGIITAFGNKTGERIALPGSIQDIKADLIEIAENGKYIAISNQNKISVIDLASTKTHFEIENPFGQNYSMSFNESGNKLAIANEDGIVRVYDTDKKQISFNVLTSQQNGMLVYDANNYYMATKEAARQLLIRENDNIYTLENFDLHLNRPDILLDHIGLANEKLVSAYKYAFDRRLKKQKAKTAKPDGKLPEITLVNKNEIKATTILDDINLKFSVSVNETVESKINIWINDVPVMHVTTSVKKDDFLQYINLKLVSGTNKIKYSITNQNGIESYKDEIVVVNLSQKKPNLYLLTIGTSEYQNNKYNLNYAAKDAKDIAQRFIDKNNVSDKKDLAFEKIFTETIVNAEVTKEKIKSATAFLKKASINDVVIIFIAGHGVRDGEMKYYFGTNDMDFNSPKTKGFSESDLATIMDEINALRKLVFFDTCLSGEVDRDEVEQIAAATTSNNNVTFRAAGAGLRPKSIGLNNASALMREIYNDITDETGSTIISSAGGAEYAMESPEWKNGLFTYCLLNGLKSMEADGNKDNTITVHEIQNYLRKEVYKLSNGKQQPSFKTENKMMDFRIW